MARIALLLAGYLLFTACGNQPKAVIGKETPADTMAQEPDSILPEPVPMPNFVPKDPRFNAKRRGPMKVEHLLVNGITLTAPTDKMGKIVALQEVFIDSIFLRGKDVIIRSERSDFYLLNIKTHKATALTHH